MSASGNISGEAMRLLILFAAPQPSWDWRMSFFRTMPDWGIVMLSGGSDWDPMFKAEARWLRSALDSFPPGRLSPLLNLGSGSAARREVIQPWIEGEVFCPLRSRGVEVLHIDMRELPGVDVRADLTDMADVRHLRPLRPRALLCANLLEHVLDPERLARNCLNLLAEGGLLFVTVPFSYPYHRDPIDTLYRPDPAELAELFLGTRLLDSTILGAGESYRDAVRERPWILLRHVWRLPVPFLSFKRWRRSMARLYWLVAEYRVTCAVFEKLWYRSHSVWPAVLRGSLARRPASCLSRMTSKSQK